MKSLLLVLLGTSIDCATVPASLITDQQRERFASSVREAEAAGIADAPREAQKLFNEAEFQFEYAQRIPRYPERARVVAAEAQREMDQALALVQAATRQRLAVRAAARQAQRAADAARAEQAQAELTAAPPPSPDGTPAGGVVAGNATADNAPKSPAQDNALDAVSP